MTDIKITPSPYGTWEYTPPAGMALTAERLAELIKHAPAPNDGDYNDGYVAALTDLHDALFPATEPAEERCQSVSIFRERCALVPGHDGRHAANGCAWGYPPAPAEPAVEETKAEAFDVNALVEQVTQAAWRERGRAEGFRGDPSIDWDTLLEWQKQDEYQSIRGALTELQRLGLFTLPASSPVVEDETKAEGPQDIEVMQWDGTRKSIQAICDWVNSFDDELDDPTISYCFSSAAPDDVLDVSLTTNEGDFVRVSDGDFIVRDTQGNFYRRDRNAYATVAASSPVVPAPTETGPWQSLNDVPAEVAKVQDSEGFNWRRVGRRSWEGQTMQGRWAKVNNPANFDYCAPFVAAEEG